MNTFNYIQQVLIDSSFRNRKRFPHPTEFETSVRPDVSYSANDPVGIGYIMAKSTVNSYDTTSPNRIELTAPIQEFENRYIGKHIEVVDPTNNHTSRGYSKIIGFSSSRLHIYIETPIAGVVLNDVVLIRQSSQSPIIRFNPNVNVSSGSNTLQMEINKGSNKSNFYKGMYLRKINGTLGIDHIITSYDTTTSPPTIVFSPSTPINLQTTDLIEIYQPVDNEGGLTSLGNYRNSASLHEVRLDWLRFPRHSLYVNNPSDFPPSLILPVNNFPYLIIEFRNKSQGSSSGVIQSNNLNVRSGQFIVPIKELSNDIGKFYTLESSSSVIVSYNPSDSIYFSVKTPSGEIIKFDSDDENPNSLILPNPDIQVSALFSIRKLN